MTIYFGKEKAKEIVGKIVNTIESLLVVPNKGVSLYNKYGIESEYYYVYSNKNYIFYRDEGVHLRIVRVLDERQGFLYTLCGIAAMNQETEEYWDE